MSGLYPSGDAISDTVDSFVGMGMGREAAEGLLSAPRWAMSKALDELDETHGGIAAYLRGPCSMDTRTVEALRDRLVA